MTSHRTLARSSSLVATAALAVLVLTACSNSEKASTLTTTTNSAAAPTTATEAAGDQAGTAALDGKTFTATKVSGRELVSGSDLTLTFEGGQVSAEAGCNNLGSAYVFDGASLEVAQMRSTMMACEPELMAQDEWITDYLVAGPDATLANDMLTLTSGDTTIELTATTP